MKHINVLFRHEYERDTINIELQAYKLMVSPIEERAARLSESFSRYKDEDHKAVIVELLLKFYNEGRHDALRTQLMELNVHISKVMEESKEMQK